MSILDWPTLERPREKLLNLGANALSDAELLAIFLRTGSKGKTAVDLARELLKESGGIRQLLEMPYKKSQIYGFGPAKYAQLQAALEMWCRYLYHTLKRTDVLNNTKDTFSYLIAKLRHRKQEIFACLFLDSQNRVIIYEELFQGSIDQAAIHPREVVKRALFHNAAAIIFAHNHPSGVAKPSQADKKITQYLKDALNLIEVRVLDHIIVGDGEMVSFAERGIL